MFFSNSEVIPIWQLERLARLPSGLQDEILKQVEDEGFIDGDLNWMERIGFLTLEASDPMRIQDRFEHWLFNFEPFGFPIGRIYFDWWWSLDWGMERHG